MRSSSPFRFVRCHLLLGVLDKRSKIIVSGEPELANIEGTCRLTRLIYSLTVLSKLGRSFLYWSACDMIDEHQSDERECCLVQQEARTIEVTSGSSGLG